MACYLVNRSPSKTIKLKTLEEVWFSSPADYSKLRVFGCLAYAYEKDDKLGLRAKKYIFLGQTNRVKGYRLWYVDPKSPQFIVSRDVTFDESAIFYKKKEYADVDRDKGTNKQVEVEVETPYTKHKEVKAQIEDIQAE